MSELEALRPEVRRIAGLFDDSLKTRSVFSDGWQIIRAELLRLASAESELAALKNENAQLRDLRAKAGTDKADTEGERAAQLLLGHTTLGMTMHYVRRRLGAKVTPTK